MAKDVKIRITADDRSKRVLGSVKRELVSLGRIASRLGRGIKSVASGITRGFRNVAVAATAATAVMVGLVKAYTVQEDAEKALAAALGFTGQKLDDTMKKYKEFAAGIQDTTRFGDEAILAQIAYARNLGVTEDKLKETTTAAVGLAAKLGIDLKTSMMLMGRAALGQTQMLTRYGITLDETLTPQEKFNTLLKIGAKNFKLAEAAAMTTGGRFSQFKNKIGDVAEGFGRGISEAIGLAGVLDNLTKRLDKMLAKWKTDGTIDEWANRVRPVLEEVSQLVTDVFGGGQARTDAIEKIKDVGTSLGNSALDILIAGAEKVGAKIAIGMLKAPGALGRRLGASEAAKVAAKGNLTQRLASENLNLATAGVGGVLKTGLSATTMGASTPVLAALSAIKTSVDKVTTATDNLKQPEGR